MALSEREERIFNELAAELAPELAPETRRRRLRLGNRRKGRPREWTGSWSRWDPTRGWQLSALITSVGLIVTVAAFTVSTVVAFAGILVALVGSLRLWSFFHDQLFVHCWRPRWWSPQRTEGEQE